MVALRLGQGFIPDSLENIDIHAVPTGMVRVLKALTLVNVTEDPCWVDLFLNDSPIPKHYIIPGIGGENTLHVKVIDQVMHEGERITAEAEFENAISYYMSGKEEEA